MEYVVTRHGDELYHYGVKGQKWGIRRYQNKDGSLTTAGKKHKDQLDKHADDIVIERGSNVSQVTNRRNLKLRGGVKLSDAAANLGLLLPVKRSMAETKTYVYDDKDPHDKLVYEGAFSKYIQGRSFLQQSPVYKMKYETACDLVSPSDEKRIDLFVESFRKTPAKYIAGMNEIEKQWKTFADIYGKDNITKDKRAMISKTINKDSSDDDLRYVGYKQFNSASESKSPKAIKAQNAYYKYLKKNGYNALIDDNNRKVYNEANNPLIVLDAKKRLKKIGMEEIPDDVIDKNIEELRKRMYKKTGSKSIAL